MEDIDGLNIVNVPNRNKAPRNVAGSCTNHGGLWGEVELICLPAIYMKDIFLTGDIHTGKLTANVSIHNTAEDDIPVLLSLNVYGRYGFDEKIVDKEIGLQVTGRDFEE